MAELNFNAHDVDPTGDLEPLPEGEYVAVIAASEQKPTKAGTGQYLELKLQVTEGPHKGRFLWDRLNLDNPNPEAVRIARGTLSAICRAVDVMEPKDSADLHNVPMTVRVRCRKRQDTGELTNEVKGYRRLQRPSASTSETPPWKAA